MCSCSLYASGFLYKMLLKTVDSILLLNLDKNKGCLSMIFHLLLKKKKKDVFFFGYYRTSWYTSQTRSRNTIISCWSCVRLILAVEIHMLVCVYIANRMPPSGSDLLFEFVTLMVAMLLHYIILKVKKLLHWWLAFCYISG